MEPVHINVLFKISLFKIFEIASFASRRHQLFFRSVFNHNKPPKSLISDTSIAWSKMLYLISFRKTGSEFNEDFRSTVIDRCCFNDWERTIRSFSFEVRENIYFNYLRRTFKHRTSPSNDIYWHHQTKFCKGKREGFKNPACLILEIIKQGVDEVKSRIAQQCFLAFCDQAYLII